MEVDSRTYNGVMSTSRKRTPQKRFAIGARVMIINPGIIGEVIQADDEPTVLWEYWHKVKTEFGEDKQPGSNLELIPTPMTNERANELRLAHNVYLQGPNARINLGSVDNSTNMASESYESLFVQMKQQAASIADDTERQNVLTRLDELEKARGSGGFLQTYNNFIA